jgi:hypothetical protein
LGYLQQSRSNRSDYPTLLLSNANSHAHRHGHKLPVRPGDAALWRRRPRLPSTVSDKLLNSKHKSSSLAGIGGLLLQA